MIRYADIPALRQAVAEARRAGYRIVLVPTMGCLHEGHAALIRLGATPVAPADAPAWVVVSIFVNPTQFGPHEDFARYPRTLEADCALCAQTGAAAVFAPDAAAMYPPGGSTLVEENHFSQGLCGASRPGHFRGVATVVAKLFNLVQPDEAIFGRKDAQQARVIQQMTRDLDFPVRIRLAPIVRDPDGLAMSSRNRYLTPAQRAQALALSRALFEVAAAWRGGTRDTAALRALALRHLGAGPDIRVEYIAFMAYDSWEPVAAAASGTLCALAVRVGETRLIDNVMLE